MGKQTFVSVKSDVRRTFNGDGFALQPLDAKRLYNVQAWNSEPDAIARALEIDPAAFTCGRILASPIGDVFRIGPLSAWLIFNEDGPKPDITEMLCADISDAWSWWRLEGSNARAILKRAVKIDVDAPHFTVGSFAMTQFWSTSGFLCYSSADQGDQYEIAFPSTYAQSVLDMMNRVFERPFFNHHKAF